MNETTIEWCNVTWNPVSGCSKVSQGCKNCYAERMFARPYPGRDFTDVRTHPDRLDQPLRMRKPKRIFVNSMSDLFHEDVPFDFIDQVFRTMIPAKQHTFQILTKRPERMLAYMAAFKPDGDGWYTRDGAPAMGEIQSSPLIADNNWPPKNVWLGVSVEDQATADERIPLLLQTPAAERFISAEPLLGPIQLGPRYFEFETDNNGPIYPGLDLVITGGESGPHARPAHPDWFRSLRDQCAAAGVAFFFKQWGEFITGKPGDKFLPFDREPDHCWSDDGDHASFRVGKKTAGRLLDGREHDEIL